MLRQNNKEQINEEYFCDSLKKGGTQGTGTAFLITDRKGTRVVYKGKAQSTKHCL